MNNLTFSVFIGVGIYSIQYHKISFLVVIIHHHNTTQMKAVTDGQYKHTHALLDLSAKANLICSRILYIRRVSIRFTPAQRKKTYYACTNAPIASSADLLPVKTRKWIFIVSEFLSMSLSHTQAVIIGL